MVAAMAMPVLRVIQTSEILSDSIDTNFRSKAALEELSSYKDVPSTQAFDEESSDVDEPVVWIDGGMQCHSPTQFIVVQKAAGSSVSAIALRSIWANCNGG